MVNYCEGLDGLILEVFEENEEQFFFPLASQKAARAFAKAIHNKGYPYEEMCKEIKELEYNFSAWRKGLGRVGIGKRILERFNQPLQEILDEEEEVDYAKLLKAVNGNRASSRVAELRGRTHDIQASEVSLRVPPTPSARDRNASTDSDSPAEEASTTENANVQHREASPSGDDIVAAKGGVASRIKSYEQRRSSSEENRSSGEESRSSGLESRSSGEETRSSGLENGSSGEESKSSGQENGSNGEESRSNGEESRSNGKDNESNGEESRSGGNESRSGSESRSSEERGLPAPEEKVSERKVEETKVAEIVDVVDVKEDSEKKFQVSNEEHAGETREERLAKIQNRIAQLKKKFPKADDIEGPREAPSSPKAKPKSATSSAEPSAPGEKVPESQPDKSKELKVTMITQEDKAPAQVGENYDSDLDVDLNDKDVSEIVLKVKQLKVKVKDGKGFVYVFSDKPAGMGKRVKIGQTRQPRAKLAQFCLFNLSIKEVCTVAVSSRFAALKEVEKQLEEYKISDGWYEAPVNTIVDIVTKVGEKFSGDSSLC